MPEFTNLRWSITTVMAAAMTLAGAMPAHAGEAGTKQKTERALDAIFGDGLSTNRLMVTTEVEFSERLTTAALATNRSACPSCFGTRHGLR